MVCPTGANLGAPTRCHVMKRSDSTAVAATARDLEAGSSFASVRLQPWDQRCRQSPALGY